MKPDFLCQVCATKEERIAADIVSQYKLAV